MAINEIWKDIPGYEDRYQVSDMGRVRSVGGVFNGKHIRRPAPRPVILHVERGGYLGVGLLKDGIRKHFPVSRLVLMAFVGPRPEGHYAAHLDGVRTNNTPSNLLWATVTENTRHRDRIHKTTARGDRHGMRIHKGLVSGEKNGKARLCRKDVDSIRAAYQNGVTQAALAVRHGVKEPAIWKILNNRTWTEGEPANV